MVLDLYLSVLLDPKLPLGHVPLSPPFPLQRGHNLTCAVAERKQCMYLLRKISHSYRTVQWSLGTRTITLVCAGMARVALRTVRHGPLDDRLKEYNDIADPILKFVAEVFGGNASQDGSTIMLSRPPFMSDVLKEAVNDDGTAPQVPLKCTRAPSSLLEIEAKVRGSEADRCSLLYMVGVFLFHSLIHEDSKELQPDAPPVLDEELDSFHAFLSGMWSDSPMSTIPTPDAEQRSDQQLPSRLEDFFEDPFDKFERAAAVKHLDALKVGALRLNTKGANVAPEKRTAALSWLKGILAMTPLDISSEDFLWLTSVA